MQRIKTAQYLWQISSQLLKIYQTLLATVPPRQDGQRGTAKSSAPLGGPAAVAGLAVPAELLGTV
jgi:hypothetical protein